MAYRKIILISLLVIAYAFAYAYSPHTSFAGTKQTTITKGLGSRKIAETLKKEGFIRSKWTFVAYVTLTNTASRLRPGNYEFDSDASIPDIVGELTSSGRHEIVITIPEGWKISELASYLDEHGVVSEENFLGVVKNPEDRSEFERFMFLRDLPKGAGLEGFLFPDTYRIFSDATAEDIVIKMLDNFDRKVTPDMREALQKKGISLFDAITMASLVEKEVASAGDRPIVAGILWKRLKIDMPLQVDATVNYVTGNRSTKVSTEETKIDSPYNTYKYPGLPKGPIANPGIETIRAAIYPKDSKYLYYLSTPDGTTIFSKTLDEHNIAKAKYLK